jgi:hypothetical protein
MLLSLLSILHHAERRTMANTIAKSQTSYPITNPPTGYMPVAQVCSFLVNVGSDMCQQWIKQGAQSSFEWVPDDPCPYTSSYSLDDYALGGPIWSTFSYHGTSYTEPFAFVAEGANANYLVFRGSQTTVDFDLDGEDPQVSYQPSGGPSGMLVEAGFYGAFAGCAAAVQAALSELNASTPLYITGHSLGSTLATLSVPIAVSLGLSGMQCNQASPRVGNPAFADYIDGLTGMPTFRLVNTDDQVPNLPPVAVRVDKQMYYYQHVGVEVEFTALYLNSKGKLDEKDEHSPCCSYSYALFNPADPVNPDITSCVATLEPKIGG